jgi:predicted Zn-dependent protease
MSALQKILDDVASEIYLSESACRALYEQVLALTRRGGSTSVSIESAWQGNLRWADNTVISGGDARLISIGIVRQINGAKGGASTTKIDADGLRELVQSAEWGVALDREEGAQFRYRHTFLPTLRPTLFFNDTARQSAADRAYAARIAVEMAQHVHTHGAGYVQISAQSVARYDTDGLARYYPSTAAQYSTTVRNAQGTGSGWAGVDFNDWRRINPSALAATATQKCLTSSDPRAIEPGRYTAILESQAVHDLFSAIVSTLQSRQAAEEMPEHPFNLRPGQAKLGLPVVDRRITVTSDPMDPDCGFIPFDSDGEPYRPATWIKDGVLNALAYGRAYAVPRFATAEALPASMAYRLHGGGVSLDEMITSTTRGVLVTRFHDVRGTDPRSLLCTGTTRDGVWLVEHGTIMYPIKNLRFNESPLFAFNRVEQIGVPQRVFSPDAPAVVPPIKVRDFNFTSLADAV